MWVVRAKFDLRTEEERVLGCGETYKITRDDEGGRALYFQTKSVSKIHAFIEVAPAPDDLKSIACDWRPTLRLLPGQQKSDPRPIGINRLRTRGEAEATSGDDNAAPQEAEYKTFNAPTDEPFEIKDGDILTLKNKVVIRVKWTPLSFCIAPKTAERWSDFEKTRAEAAGMGVPLVSSAEWQSGATHLVLKRVVLRSYVIDALHAPAALVNPAFVQDIVDAAVNAEKECTGISRVLRSMDPQAPKYQPDPPEVDDPNREEMQATLMKAMEVKPRVRPLLGRSILCFVADQDEGSRVESRHVAAVLRSLGAAVKIHSLKEQPIRTKQVALEVIRAFKSAAGTSVAEQPPEVRRHVETGQQAIIYYMGDVDSLAPIGAAAKEMNCPMPRVLGGDLDWIAYGVRQAESLLEPFTGNEEDYVDLMPSTQQLEERRASPGRRMESPVQPENARADDAAATVVPANREHVAEPTHDADGAQQPPVPTDKGADKSAEIMSLQRMQQKAASRKKDMLDALLDDDSPPRPAARSKAAQRRAAEAQAAQNRQTTGTERATETSAGPSRTTSGRSRRAPMDLDDMFGDISESADGRSAIGGNTAGSKQTPQESTTRQLRAALNEEARSQAAGATQLEAMGLTAGGSLLTQAIPEGGDGGDDETRSQAPLTPLVEMDQSGPSDSQASAQRGGRKRNASPSPDRGDASTVRRAKRRKHGADEGVKEGGGEKTGQGDKQQREGEPSAAMQAPVVRGHKHKETGKGPDKDEQFLRAVSTIEKRKKADPFDKEFNQLRIAKPVYDAGGRRVRTEAEAGSGKGGVQVVRSGARANATDAQDEEEDEEFQRFKELADDDLDWNLRGNFMQVDFVPLVVERAEARPFRIEPDGRPNFKAFRRKGQAKKVVDPVRVISTVLDDMPQLQIGEDSVMDMVASKRTTYGGADDEELEEDDADFTGLHPPSRTYSGNRAKTAKRFQFSLGDDENPRADAASQREAPEPSGTGRRGRSQGATASSGRGRGGRARAQTQYVEVSDDEEESDPEAGLLLNLDEEVGLDEQDQAAETQFSLDSQSAAPSKRAKRGATGAGGGGRGGKKAFVAPPQTSAQAGGASSSRHATASNQSSQLFRGISDSLDPLGEQESSLDPSAAVDPTTTSGSAAGSSVNAPPGSVVPASRPMDDEDTFMGFGASGRRKRTGATGGTAGSAASGASGSRSLARGRSRF
ncbi:unnamed protein product [Tilletia controversa]|nr:unnamed protein product [Tilletia controversa]CAD6902063.1 unnamed protein product [Tilletia controversa]